MATYRPELLHVFQGIFDEIWQDMEPNLSPDKRDERRSELARRIILAHRRGLQPDRIKVQVRQEMKTVDD